MLGKADILIYCHFLGRRLPPQASAWMMVCSARRGLLNTMLPFDEEFLPSGIISAETKWLSRMGRIVRRSHRRD